LIDFNDALNELQKVMDKDTKYQKECDALLDKKLQQPKEKKDD
tara:strand:+ start:1581 stop:1709 length:129 start_codon:yes stop_codon:yes gene_type:complete